MKKKTTKIAKIGRVHKIGGSLMITLPAEFTSFHGIKKGDDVGLLANHLLTIHPMKEGELEKEKSEATIEKIHE